MSVPSSAMTMIASGLTLVASVPALYASKRSPARCLNSPSAIWLLAELWVHRKRTLAFGAFWTSADAAGVEVGLSTGHSPWPRVQAEHCFHLRKEVRGGLPVEGVEAPPAALLLAHQPGLLELAQMVGDLG